MHLAALHGQKNIIAALVADDHLVLHAQNPKGEMGEKAGLIRGVERADHEHVGLGDIGGLLEAAGNTGCAGVENAGVRRSPQKFEILVTRAHVRQLERLREGIPGTPEDREPIGLGSFGEIIGRQQTARARHVLHDENGCALQMLLDDLREHPCEEINRSPGFKPHHDADGLALVKGLGLGSRGRRQQGRDQPCAGPQQTQRPSQPSHLTPSPGYLQLR